MGWNALDSEREMQLRQLIEEYALLPIAEEVVALAQCCIVMEPGELEERVVGQSRLAGMPDVPRDFVWPVGHNGEHMIFVAQINLADVAPYDTHHLLPPAGLLSFFSSDDAPADDVACAISYFPPSVLAQLTPFTPPSGWEWHFVDDLDDEDIEDFLADSYAVTFTPGISLPGSGTLYEHLSRPDEVAGSAIDDLMDAYDRLRWQVHDEDAIHLFGYTVEIDNPFADAQRHHPLPPEDEWCLLLEVSSHPQTPFMWWDAGYLHFLSSRTALAQHQFTTLHAGIETS